MVTFLPANQFADIDGSGFNNNGTRKIRYKIPPNPLIIDGLIQQMMSDNEYCHCNRLAVSNSRCYEHYGLEEGRQNLFAVISSIGGGEICDNLSEFGTLLIKLLNLVDLNCCYCNRLILPPLHTISSFLNMKLHECPYVGLGRKFMHTSCLESLINEEKIRATCEIGRK